jgi:hypothetical protein
MEALQTRKTGTAGDRTVVLYRGNIVSTELDHRMDAALVIDALSRDFSHH